MSRYLKIAIIALILLILAGTGMLYLNKKDNTPPQKCDVIFSPECQDYLFKVTKDKNFEEAKELLASIGLLDESTGQVNQTVEFTYLVNNSESNVKIGEAIQADLSKVGINLKVEQQEWNVFLNSRKDGQFDFAREGWLMDYNDPINMLEMFTTKSGNNDMQFGR